MSFEGDAYIRQEREQEDKEELRLYREQDIAVRRLIKLAGKLVGSEYENVGVIQTALSWLERLREENAELKENLSQHQAHHGYLHEKLNQELDKRNALLDKIEKLTQQPKEEPCTSSKQS